MTDKFRNYREVESSIKTDFKDDMSYAEYLDLDRIMSAQHPLSNEHDEMLFIIIHQASELWLKLVTFELAAAIREIEDGNLPRAFKVMSRIKTIIRQLTQSWTILSTLTPVDYLKFRDQLGNASGFQSCNYRLVEFLLGNKNAQVIRVFKNRPKARAALEAALVAPGLYDVVIAHLKSRGLPVSDEVLRRDVSEPYDAQDSVEAAWLEVYRDAEHYFDLYELGEKLVDLEDALQQWRFKHMATVRRIIGHKTGTGGSSGVGFLKKALDTSFFPELMAVRTDL